MALEALIAYATVLLKKTDNARALHKFKKALAVAKAKRRPKSQLSEIQKKINECKFWIKKGLTTERLELAHHRAAKAHQAANWRELSGHW